jgi:flagellar motor switch protein FliN/FliY
MTDVASVPSASDIEHATDVLDQNFDLLAGVTIRVSVEVGSASLKLSELLNIGKGSVVELDRDANALLDILANGTLIARGEVVSIDGRYGIRVAEIVERRSGFDRRSAERGISDRRAA